MAILKGQLETHEGDILYPKTSYDQIENTPAIPKYNLATTATDGLVKKLPGGTGHILRSDNTWQTVANMIDARVKQLILAAFPVGSVIQSTNSANPSTYLGGTWQQIAQGRTLIGAGTGNDGATSMSFASGSTGGEYKHKLTIAELARHNHGANILQFYTGNRNQNGSGNNAWFGDTTYTGQDSPHNNVQPYYVVYMFKRTA